VEMKLVVGGDFEGAEVYSGILVAGETDEADLAGLFGFKHCLHAAAFSEDTIGVFHAKDFVKLQQIHMIGLQTAQRFIDLFGDGGTSAAIDLSHEKDPLPIAIAQGPAHPFFAAAIMIIPTVVHEIDAAINRLTDDQNAFL